MRKAKRWRYYCDFCKKSGGSAYHMRNHESACTMNSDRHCNMCALLDMVHSPMNRLKAIVDTYSDRIENSLFTPCKHEDGEKACDELLLALRKETDDCPACIFAALRQTEVWQVSFDFKKECAIFMSRVNDYKAEETSFGAY